MERGPGEPVVGLLNVVAKGHRARINLLFTRNARFFGLGKAVFTQQREPRVGPKGERSVPQTLVLNATYEPLGVVSERRALILVLNQRATMIEESDTVLHYSGGEIVLPAVVKLTRFVRIPYRHSVPLSRRALFARDSGRCVYCTAPATSIDHVIPRSRGGAHTWENVVSACHRCNHAKADRTLKEIGWKLRTLPREPAGAAWRILGTGKADSRWVSYLKPFGVDLGAAAAASA